MTVEAAQPERWLTPKSPLTGETVGTVLVTEPGDVGAVVDQSRLAFGDWGQLSHAERKPYLRALARHVRHSMDRIATVVSAETGKDPGGSRIEVVGGLTAIDFYTRSAEKILRPKKGTSWPFVITKGWTEYHPIGVAGLITPWNYPFYLPLIAAIQALSAGCTVVLKPSELTPLSGQLVADLAIEAGLPEGVVQVVQGDGQTGAALVAADTNIITFIGSPQVGKRIAAEAAKTLKPVVLELGGNDAQIVLEDANVKNAARAAVTFGVFNAGQTCTGMERVSVVDEIYDKFMAEAPKASTRLTTGTRDGRDIGPIISPPQADIVRAHLEDAVDKGAVVLVGGLQTKTSHAIYFDPTLVENVDHSMILMRDETFGPIVPVMRDADEDEAIKLANDTPYGLHGSVWTRDRARGSRVAARMKTGSVAVNDHMINFVFPSIKLGGIGESGLNGQLGEEGIKAYTIHRSITSARFAPTTKLMGAWLPRRVGNGWWKNLARVLFGWRR